MLPTTALAAPCKPCRCSFSFTVILPLLYNRRPRINSLPSTSQLRQNFFGQSRGFLLVERRRNSRNVHRRPQHGSRCVRSRGVHKFMSHDCTLCGGPWYSDSDVRGIVLHCRRGKSRISETGPKGKSFFCCF